MTRQRLAGLVRQQARACARLGSPLYAQLLEQVADDVLSGGPSARVLAGHEDDDESAAVPLRLAAGVHRLALSGRAPQLASHYPSCGGDGDAGAAWKAFRRTLADHSEEIRRSLHTAPQTNDVGRAAPLLGALLSADAPAVLPVRIWEIGASAGLNLRADRFRYRAQDGAAWGPADSPVVLDPAWDRVPPGVPAELEVVERVGADVAPVDVSDADAELTLAAYVWPDQQARLQRLRAAVVVARAVPARLVAARARDLLRDLTLVDGTVTVVWHSVMWQYVEHEEQREIEARLEELGASAAPDRRFLHVAFEPAGSMFGAGPGFVVTRTQWPGGRREVVGRAPPHGVPVTWWPRPASQGRPG